MVLSSRRQGVSHTAVTFSLAVAVAAAVLSLFLLQFASITVSGDSEKSVPVAVDSNATARVLGRLPSACLAQV